jgi:hypothetical protein
MIKKTGLAAATIGLLGALGGWLWHLLVPTLDANIGAGLLVVLGLPLAGVGGLLLLVSAVRVRAR